ncbi:hypothetical protein FQT07_13905 [Enterococcus hirae]|nr:hypothetical protein [Enterococcus hirae]
MTDSKTKTELLAKIDTAQKALDAVTQETAKVKEATEAVNALFNGDTPKPENTQDQINAAKAKVDALTDSKTKTELLAKIDTAQKALDESQKFKITSIDPYVEGENQFVSGKYTGKGAAYIRVVVNGEKKSLVSMKGLLQGTFKYYVAGLKASDKVTVQIFDSSYKQLAEEALTVKKVEPVKITNIDPYIEGKSQYITGEYTGDGPKYIQVIVNGKKQTFVPMSGLPKGTFKYYLTGLKETDKVSVVLYDGMYKQLVEKPITIQGTLKITSIDPYVEGKSQFIVGKYTGEGAAYIQAIVNGKKKAIVPMSGLLKGTLKYYLAGLKTDNKVSIEIYDHDYVRLAEKDVPIEK